MLRFVIVGGGPTGVELAGTIAELAHHTLAADFRRIDPRSATITLVEAGPRLLPYLDESLSDYARESLARLGVEVLLGTPVSHCDEQGVEIGGDRIASATVLWAAGVAASPVGQWLGEDTDRAGRVVVQPDLSTKSDPKIFVIGDAALIKSVGGVPVPGIAPAAKQQGHFVADLICKRIAGKTAVRTFHYRHAGYLATIGRRSAVIEFPRYKIKGGLAWWIWGIAHIYFLIGVRSPLLVAMHWLWEYITYSRGARLITGEQADSGSPTKQRNRKTVR